MPAQKFTASSVFGAVLGTLGFSALAGALVTVMVAPAIAVAGMTASNSIGVFESLPEYIELGQLNQRNTIVTDNGDGTYTTIATIYDQNREEVPLDQISKYLQEAAIDGEDRRFYSHGGVDVPSVIRAALGGIGGSSGSGGASTLSMQTVRNILQQQALNNPNFTTAQKQQAIKDALAPTFDRKLKEMKLAIGLEKRYSKDEILAGYLNIAGFGGNTYGVEAAAQQYFSVSAKDVTIAQAASLIAIVQYPNLRDLQDPSHYQANQDRRDVILSAMHAQGDITEQELQDALATKVDANFVKPSAPTNGCLNAQPAAMRFPCDYVLNSVKDLAALGNSADERMANWKKGGYTLVSTFNLNLQVNADAIVHNKAPKEETRFALGAAVTSVQVGTGRILIMAQNKDFDNRLDGVPSTATAVNFNADKDHGGSVGFQPGSTYKPYTLLSFLAAGHGVNESFDAGKLELNQAAFADRCNGPYGGTYKFKNDAGEHGSYTVMRGTAGSVNSVFLQMGTKVDQCDTRDIARSIGVHRADGAADGSDLFTEPSCVIGGCENNIAPETAAAAFAAIADQGVFCEPISVDKVIAPDGKTVLPGEDAHCGQSALVAPNVANTAAYAMQGVLSGTAAASNPNDGTPYLGKTGTTDASVHTWMVGSSTSVATAVWVGNISGKQAMRSISVNGTQAAVLRHRIFKPIAQSIDAIAPGHAFPGPDPALLTGSPATVPDVTGLSPEAAKAAIELAELVYADGGQADSDLPVGTVASSNPGAGSSVPKGTTITVYTSNGQATALPNVVGQKTGDAIAALHSAGFDNVDTSTCVPPDNPSDTPPPGGIVTVQNPASGTINKNTVIKLTIKKLTC